MKQWTVCNGVGLIASERQRQIESEGWDWSHDDDHGDGELAMAAACYATPRQIYVAAGPGAFRDPWPWRREWDKRQKHDRFRQLAIAGALIAAEIDRLQRLESDTVATEEGRESPHITALVEACKAALKAIPAAAPADFSHRAELTNVLDQLAAAIAETEAKHE